MKQTLPLLKEKGVIRSHSDVIIKALLPFLRKLGYEDRDLEFERPLAVPLQIQIGSKKVGIKKPDILAKGNGRYLMVVEAKNPKESITKDVIGQAVSYAVLLGAPYALVSNGEIVEMFRVRSILQYTQTPILTKEQVLKEVSPRFSRRDTEEAKRTLITFKERKEFANVFNVCHDIIRTQKGLGAKERLYEMCKILFVKLNEEDRFYKEMSENRFSTRVFAEMEKRGIDARAFMNDTLFKLTKRRLTGTFNGETVSIFEKEDKVELGSHTIKELVAELERYTLSQTGEDIIGVAFETFLRGTMTGKELGEFFTPRELVDFMVDLVNPKIGERVIDPACGSGGFLIKVFKTIRREIERLPIAKLEKMKYSDDLIDQCLWGIDIDRSLTKLCQANLILHGDGFGHIYQHNALIGPEVDRITKNQKFQLVITNPPFGRGKGKDVTDPEILHHYRLGRNKKKQSPQILFIERCIDLLEGGGRFLTVIDDGILNNSTLGYVRDFIKEKTIIEAVVSLPRGTFNPYGSGVKPSVLYLRKKENPNEKQGDIFMAIARHVGFDTRRRTRYIKIDENDLPDIRKLYKQRIK